MSDTTNEIFYVVNVRLFIGIISETHSFDLDTEVILLVATKLPKTSVFAFQWMRGRTVIMWKS